MNVRPPSGVTLIELLIGIVVLGLLMTLGVPAFSAWMQNAQIRTAADAVLNGLQVARTEALKRNVPVEFRLDEGTNWTVAALVTPPEIVQQRQGDEGSSKAMVTAGGRLAVTFSPLGAPMQTNPVDASNPITQVDVTSALTGMDGIRALRIMVSVAGSVRMCDPDTNVPELRAGDPRRCNQ